MLFNSYGFIFMYLPVALLGFFWLALASLFFYGYWNPAYIGLLLGSISCNYAFGLWIAKARNQESGASKKQLLIAALSANPGRGLLYESIMARQL